MADIERAIDRALARQLPPIRRAIEESKDRQRFSDIVGGIGYIIGLMGLALYFRSRQLQRRQ
jgi:nickel transport protein